MPVTSNDIANQALQLIGDNMPLVTGQNPLWDSSPAGVALRYLYGPCVATVQRRFAWDASRRVVALTASGNTGPFLFGQFTGEYLYPSNGIEVWLIQPATLADQNDPLPLNFSTGNTLVGGEQKKVLWTSVPAPRAVYNNNPSEDTWDAGFREAVVRMLASELAEAVAGRPDTEAVQLAAADKAASLATARDN
jgi:hypothetical protein